MAEVLRRLGEEHANLARLLNAMEHQLAVFDRGEQPDYDVLTAAAEYFTEFPDRCHHPKEDLIFRRLREKDPAAAEAIGDLEGEHSEISENVHRFREAVARVRDEVEVPRSAFDAVMRNFIDDLRRHMKMEQEHFFPAALKVLDEADWADIDRQVTDEDDPLFGAKASGKYESLLQDILAWEREDEAAGR